MPLNSIEWFISDNLHCSPFILCWSHGAIQTCGWLGFGKKMFEFFFKSWMLLKVKKIYPWALVAGYHSCQAFWSSWWYLLYWNWIIVSAAFLLILSCLDILQTSASLKFTVLNPKGRIWTMVAGGGASVIYADTVSIFRTCDARKYFLSCHYSSCMKCQHK